MAWDGRRAATKAGFSELVDAAARKPSPRLRPHHHCQPSSGTVGGDWRSRFTNPAPRSRWGPASAGHDPSEPVTRGPGLDPLSRSRAAPGHDGPRFGGVRRGKALAQGTSMAPCSSLRRRAPRGGGFLRLRVGPIERSWCTPCIKPSVTACPLRRAGRHRARERPDSSGISRSGARPECNVSRPSGRRAALGFMVRVQTTFGSDVHGSVVGDAPIFGLEPRGRHRSRGQARKPASQLDVVEVFGPRRQSGRCPGTQLDPCRAETFGSWTDQAELEGETSHLGGPSSLWRWKAKSGCRIERGAS